MNEAFWNGLFDVRWEDAPLGREAIRLVMWLRERGYAERTRRDHGHAVVHLGRVLHEARVETAPQALDEATVEDFIDHHLPVCRCYRWRAGRRADAAQCGLKHLLAMLREEGVIPPLVLEQPPYHELLEGYSRFLRDDRGLAETTIINYRRYVRDFLIGRGDAVSADELARLTEDDLLAFGRERGVALGVTAWNHVALSLSSFWRWLDLRGHGTKHLIGAVPLRRRYRLAEVPCALSWGQVQRLLAVVDRGEPNGRRNYAMLLLTATYGLRGCEVRSLRVDDIDWSNNEITIFAPKIGRRRKLPLMQPAGEAILDYLREERPPSLERQLPSSTIDEAFASAWLAPCDSRGPNTRVARYHLLRRVCRFLAKRRPGTFIPGESLRPRRRPAALPHIYSREEVRLLLDGALTLPDWERWHPCPIRSKTMHAIILLLATAGLRISEALHLTLQDVDLEQGVLSIRQSKSRKSRLVPLSTGTALRNATSAPTPSSPIETALSSCSASRRAAFPQRPRPVPGTLRCRDDHQALHRRGSQAATVTRRKTHQPPYPAPHRRHASASIRCGAQRHQVLAGSRQHHHDEPVHRDRHGNEARGDRALHSSGPRSDR
jgi:integrase